MLLKKNIGNMNPFKVGDGWESSFSSINFKSETPRYLLELISFWSSCKRQDQIQTILFCNFFSSAVSFRIPFIPSTMIEWSKLDVSIHNASYFEVFKKQVLFFIRPSGSSQYKVSNIASTTRHVLKKWEQDNSPLDNCPPPYNSHLGKLHPDNCTWTISS